MFIFGQIDVFIGVIRSEGTDMEQYEPEFESECGFATMTQTDGEESVGSPEEGESVSRVSEDPIVTQLTCQIWIQTRSQSTFVR